MPRIFLLMLTVAFTAACEQRTVSSSFDGTGYSPSRTRFEGSQEQDLRKAAGIKDDGFPNPFEPIGDGLANLFGGEKQKNAPSAQLRTGDGPTQAVPPQFTGNREFTDEDGNAYTLKFKNGVMTDVEPAAAAKKTPAE